MIYETIIPGKDGWNPRLIMKELPAPEKTGSDQSVVRWKAEKGAIGYIVFLEDKIMLIPSNKLIKAAIDTAMSKIPLWLGRQATDADRLKFEKWIVRACFFNKRLVADQIDGTEDQDCVGGYVKSDGDDATYTAVDAAMWRPTVQKVRTTDAVTASNGFAYYIDYLKIPNNVVIYRLKTRFYEVWDKMKMDQDWISSHFVWNHWTEPRTEGESNSYSVSSALPTVYYGLLTAIPDATAQKDSLECSVSYKGVLFNEDTQNVTDCYLPAGEYYLRMGFQNNLMYSLSIQFNGTYLVKDMVMWAQGAHYHFDRGGSGYPEGFNPSDWADSKAGSYDTDGYLVGIVTIPKDGNFVIKVSSKDMCYLYKKSGALRDGASANYQLKMYHWCLRPTKNNY